MATSIQVIRREDLGANLTEQDGQLVARTIVKQANINGEDLLIDSNNQVMPLEKWATGNYWATLRGTLRTLQLADFTWEDQGGGAWRVTLPAGTVISTIASVGASTDYNFANNLTLNGQANGALEMTHQKPPGGPYGALFGKPLTDFPYIDFYAWKKDGTPMLPGDPAEDVEGSVYLGGQYAIGQLPAGAVKASLTNNALLLTVDMTGSLNIVSKTDKVWNVPPGDTSVFNFADWNNRTQAELDVMQSVLGEHLLAGFNASANGNTAPPFQHESTVSADFNLVPHGKPLLNRPTN